MLFPYRLWLSLIGMFVLLLLTTIALGYGVGL